jgi:hypothetical protein
MKLNKRRLQQIIKEELVKVLQEENSKYDKYKDQHIYPAETQAVPDLGRADFGRGDRPKLHDLQPEYQPRFRQDNPQYDEHSWMRKLESDVLHGQRVADEYEYGAFADLNPDYLPPGRLKNRHDEEGLHSSAVRGGEQRPADNWKDWHRSGGGDERNTWGPRRRFSDEIGKPRDPAWEHGDEEAASKAAPEVPWWELGDDDESKYGSGGGA